MKILEHKAPRWMPRAMARWWEDVPLEYVTCRCDDGERGDRVYCTPHDADWNNPFVDDPR